MRITFSKKFVKNFKKKVREKHHKRRDFHWQNQQVRHQWTRRSPENDSWNWWTSQTRVWTSKRNQNAFLPLMNMKIFKMKQKLPMKPLTHCCLSSNECTEHQNSEAYLVKRFKKQRWTILLHPGIIFSATRRKKTGELP